MNFALKAADRLAQGLALIAGLAVVAMLIHVALDVGTRNLAGRPIPATNEIVSRYYMVAIAFLPLAWVERRDAMVKVELTDALTSDRIGRWNDAIVALIAVVIYAGLSWVAWGEALDSAAKRTFVDVLGYRIATWPTFFLPAVGFAAAALAAGLRGILLISGRREAAA